ncbi:MAG TPA: HDOD domain-containing protein [Tepidisphaeraceae bacterium]|jgi:HD-like signal output (HDOD) protein/ActR/RegA family two-component response regulator|nr:HDOD domain-containing protein [Tepidisphaeraceae bacterium]
MSTILIVDDSAICREPIAAALRLKGYKTVCAADGLEALAALEKEKPALALLDISMPRMDGITLLAAMRKHPDYKSIPVILLTAVQDRDTILRARHLGVRDYLLKSHFSLDDMITRVKKHLADADPANTAPPTAKSAASSTTPSPAASAKSTPALTASPKIPTDTSAIRPLLTREQTTARVEECTTTRTLAGVVAEIIAATNSPRGAISDVAALLKKDPFLSARVIHVANSAAFTSQKAHITTVEDAVRNIGVGAVRGIVSSVGIFETFPPDAKDGFNIMRCWQHSFAVAAIMEKLVGDDGPIPRPSAQLIGLCHDLGEIVLRQVFSDEFSASLEMAAKSGKSAHAVQATVFGIPHAELTTLVLTKLGLPHLITAPIREHHDLFTRPNVTPREPATRILRIADHLAHGMMLASSPESPISIFTETERKNALGAHEIAINDEELRTEAMLTTSLLARLNSEETTRLAHPPFPRNPARTCYVRHPALSAIDPIASALKLLAHTNINDHLPKNAAELADAAVLIITTPTSTAKGLALGEVEMARKACGKPTLPVLYITNTIDESSRLQLANLTVMSHPLPLSRLAHFLEALTTAEAQAA